MINFTFKKMEKCFRYYKKILNNKKGILIIKSLTKVNYK